MEDDNFSATLIGPPSDQICHSVGVKLALVSKVVNLNVWMCHSLKAMMLNTDIVRYS